MLMGAVDWLRRGSYHTAWAVPVILHAPVRMRTGYWRAVLATASQVVEAIAPLMKLWCAEGDVPTAANLNLYRGLQSRWLALR